MGGGPSISQPSFYNNPYLSSYGSGQLGAFQGLQGAAAGFSSLPSYASGFLSNAMPGLSANNTGALTGLSPYLTSAGLNGLGGISGLLSSGLLPGIAGSGASSLMGAGNSILNSAFNPNTGLYNTLSQDQSQQTAAMLAGTGLGNSGAGFNMYQNAMDQFNQNWAQNITGLQATGINAASQAYGGALGLGTGAMTGLGSGISALGSGANSTLGLSMLPNTAAASLLGLQGGALSSALSPALSYSNLLSTIFNAGQMPINSQNQLASQQQQIAANLSAGNKSGYGQGIGGLLGAGGTLGSAALMSGSPISTMADFTPMVF